MAFADIRKFQYQNPTSGKIYEAVLKQLADGTIDGVGILLGTNKINSDPSNDNTKVTFVVRTAVKADVFGPAAKTDTHLATATLYDAANKAGVGALLSTLLV